VLVGVPIWWKTTEVYRSPLPYEQINELKTQESSSLPSCTIDIISIITNTDGLSLSKTINNTISVAGSQYHTSCAVKLTDKSDDLHDMNSIYRHITNNYINETNHSIGRYIIYVVPQGSIENGSMFISDKRHAMVEYIDERQLQKDVTDITDVFCGLKSRTESSNNKVNIFLTNFVVICSVDRKGLKLHKDIILI
jgi:phosphatidylinositol glycan class S